MNRKAEYLKTNEEQENRINDIRKLFSSIYDYVENKCKSSRETSLSLTKLEEAQFWAIKGITRE